jgi:hypothetical protein
MDPVQRRAELPLQVGKRQRQRRAPANQYVIVAIPHAFVGLNIAGKNFASKPDDFAQPPPHPVTLHRIANLPRHCEADANAAIVAARARLQYKSAGRCPQAARSGAKVGPAS